MLTVYISFICVTGMCIYGSTLIAVHAVACLRSLVYLHLELNVLGVGWLCVCVCLFVFDVKWNYLLSSQCRNLIAWFFRGVFLCYVMQKS